MNVTTGRLSKMQIGLAAAAVTAAATIAPVAAHAEPISMPTVPASPISEIFGTDPIAGPITIATDVVWPWLGNDKAAALAEPGGTTIFEFEPLAFVPGFLKPFAQQLLNVIPSFNVCVAGLGVSVGPYGRVSVKSGAC